MVVVVGLLFLCCVEFALLRCRVLPGCSACRYPAKPTARFRSSACAALSSLDEIAQ